MSRSLSLLQLPSPHRLRLLFFAFAASVFALHLYVPVAEADEYVWSPEFAYEGFNGRVASAVVYKGELVVAGRFYSNGEVITPDVARWDGSEWHPMGDLPFVGLGALALGVYKKELYIGGQGFDYGLLMRWDGADWVLASPVVGQISPIGDMVQYNNLLWVATYPGGLGAWDGSQFVSTGVNPPATTNSIVSDMMVFDGQLFMTGFFRYDQALGPMSGIACFDGTTWKL